MPNITQTDFPITLGGNEYRLAFPLPAMWEFEDAAGVEIFAEAKNENETPEEAQKEFDQRVFGKTKRERMKRMALMLWAGLTTNHPEITKEKAMALVYPHNMAYVRDCVIAAFSASIAGPAKEESADPEKAANVSA